MNQPVAITRDNPFAFVVFGGLGDLSKRKLLPALYSLYKSGQLGDDFAIVAVDLKELSQKEYMENAKEDIKKYTNYSVDEKIWKKFSHHVSYLKITDSNGAYLYHDLKKHLSELDHRFHTSGNRLFYMAVPPDLFREITEKLYLEGMLENINSWQRMIIEKPFGSNLSTAKELNEKLTSMISEDHIFRIDHYLGKEMVQNIVAIRFSNSIFESLWNHNYIDHIQILATESIGIESRGTYYETAGIMRDMLQNHILQMLALVCMEPPVKFEPEYIRDEKVKVLKNLRLLTENSKENIVLGQYREGTVNNEVVKGYRQEEGVSDESSVPTFIALKAEVDNFRWGGVPIYIKSGKRLQERSSKIIISFKKLPEVDSFIGAGYVLPNQLVIKIQPDEGVFFQINAKVPGNAFLLEPIRMDYCQACRFMHNSPESYERLIAEAAKNNMSLFTRWDELENAWTYVDQLDNVGNKKTKVEPNYPAGSEGPLEARELIEKDDRKWWSDQNKE